MTGHLGWAGQAADTGLDGLDGVTTLSIGAGVDCGGVSECVYSDCFHTTVNAHLYQPTRTSTLGYIWHDQKSGTTSGEQRLWP